MIKAIQQFETRGRKFDTFAQALQHRENLIEEFLRLAPGFNDMPARARIGFIQHLLDNREQFRQLLDYSSEAPAIDD